MRDNILSPKRITAEAFTDAAPAVPRLAEIYEPRCKSRSGRVTEVSHMPGPETKP